MKTEIINENKNPFLHRKELLMEIHSEAAPSNDSIKEALGKEGELTVVRKVHSNFGKSKFLAEIMIYDSKEAKEKVEVIPKKIRIKLEKERKAAEEARKKEEAEKKAAEEAVKAEPEAKPAEGENKEESSTEKKSEEPATEVKTEEKIEDKPKEDSK